MNYGKIKPTDISNGLGVRVSVFFSGCPHHCTGCFNPELWNYNAGQEFDFYTIRKILELCSHDYINGLSLLGGEPLAPENINGVRDLCYLFKKYFPDKDIWCYTGYRWEEIKQLHVMKYIDVLVDGKFVQALKDPRLKFRGSSNQRIIDVRKSLDSGKIFVRKELME